MADSISQVKSLFRNELHLPLSNPAYLHTCLVHCPASKSDTPLVLLCCSMMHVGMLQDGSEGSSLGASELGSPESKPSKPSSKPPGFEVAHGAIQIFMSGHRSEQRVATESQDWTQIKAKSCGENDFVRWLASPIFFLSNQASIDLIDKLLSMQAQVN